MSVLILRVSVKLYLAHPLQLTEAEVSVLIPRVSVRLYLAHVLQLTEAQMSVLINSFQNTVMAHCRFLLLK